jgi:HEAT repeat protein
VLQALLPRLRSVDPGVQQAAIRELNELEERKSEASMSFSDAELALLDGLRFDFGSDDPAARRVAVRAIATLARIGSSKSVPLLVENLTFRDPAVTVYERGPLSYSDPEPKDLPVFTALLQLGDGAANALYQRAIADSDPLVQRSLGELLAVEYGVKGGLAWLERASVDASQEEPQHSRIAAIRTAIESKR